MNGYGNHFPPPISIWYYIILTVIFTLILSHTIFAIIMNSSVGSAGIKVFDFICFNTKDRVGICSNQVQTESRAHTHLNTHTNTHEKNNIEKKVYPSVY